MCGIFALLNNSKINDINSEFMKGKKRGPEFSKLENYIKCSLGFHRLAINGLNETSNQPIIFNNIILICNGEIYNYKQLYKTINVIPNTQSDCEVIIHLYIKYGIEQTLLMLDGVFSFILLDTRIKCKNNELIFIARDPLGVRPLYVLENKNNIHTTYNLYGFASEIKCLHKFYNEKSLHYNIKQFKPGSYSMFKLDYKVNSKWEPVINNAKYYLLPQSSSVLTNGGALSITDYQKGISQLLCNN